MRHRFISDGVKRGAIVDGPNEEYRYTLFRQWGPGPLVLWVLANPSTADAEEDDPTCVRGMGFSRRWGFGGMVFVNLCAWRATDPKQLLAAYATGADVVGPKNESTLKFMAESLRFVVCAWGDCLGSPGERHWRPKALSALAQAKDAELKCFGLTARRNPKHPLMLPYRTQLEPYEVPR